MATSRNRKTFSVGLRVLRFDARPRSADCCPCSRANFYILQLEFIESLSMIKLAILRWYKARRQSKSRDVYNSLRLTSPNAERETETSQPNTSSPVSADGSNALTSPYNKGSIVKSLPCSVCLEGIPLGQASADMLESRGKHTSAQPGSPEDDNCPVQLDTYVCSDTSEQDFAGKKRPHTSDLSNLVRTYD